MRSKIRSPPRVMVSSRPAMAESTMREDMLSGVSSSGSLSLALKAVSILRPFLEPTGVLRSAGGATGTYGFVNWTRGGP